MPDKTLLIIRINAKDMEKLDETVAAVKGIKSGAVKDVRREPIGFGVEVIKAGILIDSKDESLPDRVISEISALEEVEDAEIEGMTLL
ncbi:MAG: elongation factor 1-beta [Candidatus Diapherotrites archaeon]|uniref:Elongation factor 1-beta n=1 Tax=Candidatus Iainarchaeum sp. TaxID=3101447 RepID=A0A8T3YN92_9ARCH|nr:elongation factor 1-beta [Candidatus Diapherotrites archaeon]